MNVVSPPPGAALRLDLWLFHARFCKTRALAKRFIETARVRINGQATEKAHANVRAGDVLTFAQGAHVRVVKILALGERRGPAAEAQSLYEDLAPIAPVAPKPPLSAAAPAIGWGARHGRPTKRERRQTDRLRDIE
jgi:ribosome-associated heat shock protein Hsp15